MWRLTSRADSACLMECDWPGYPKSEGKGNWPALKELPSQRLARSGPFHATIVHAFDKKPPEDAMSLLLATDSRRRKRSHRPSKNLNDRIKFNVTVGPPYDRTKN